MILARRWVGVGLQAAMRPGRASKLIPAKRANFRSLDAQSRRKVDIEPSFDSLRRFLSARGGDWLEL